jgi:hypothetical protein
LNLFRFSSFGFRASAKPAVCQQKGQANARPTRPITTLYYTFHPNSLIGKTPFRRQFGPETNPHNAPKIAIPRIQRDRTPSGAPKNPTRTLEAFTEESTATLEIFSENPAGASENPIRTPQSFPESPAEAPKDPRSRPRNPHLSRKERRKKISILNFRRQKFNKGQRPKSYEKIPPLTQPRQERHPPRIPYNLPILPVRPQITYFFMQNKPNSS